MGFGRLAAVTIQEVNFSGDGPGRVVLPPPDAITARLIREAGGRRDWLAKITVSNPECLQAWAALGERWESEADSSVMAVVGAYACFRVGYHRGLDALRAVGWRGAQLVKWEDRHNRGFLLCLEGLGRMAERIGENEERVRCAVFLHQLDPDRYPPVAGDETR